MGWFADVYDRYSPLQSSLRGDWKETLNRITPGRLLSDMTGYTNFRNTRDSINQQIGYEQYLKQGNERSLNDWNKNVGRKGRTIRYPELSYAGQIYRADTSIARSMFDYDTAGANYFGNLPYRTSGLYGVFSRLSRSL